MTAPGILLALFLATSLSAAHAATLRVGPGENFTRIADAARLAKDGDIVEILPGEYRGDVAVWQQKQLTIRGIGQRPVLIADGKSAEGKAIWVIRNGDFRIENIEFRGSRVPAGNGTGIRFEGGKLTVRHCAFIDNQMGILTSNDGLSELIIDNSRFADAPRQMHVLPHLLYVGRIARLTLTNSRFENGYRGHLVKSRARHSTMRDNRIVDGPEGEASYEIDLPNGGIADITGNTIGQSARTQNAVLISYGAEGNVWPDNALTLTNNTLISELMPAGWFLRVHKDKLTTPPKITAINNLTVGPGVFTLGASGEFHGNLPTLSLMLSNPQTLDFSLPKSSPLRLFGFGAEKPTDEWLPKAEFNLPIGTRPLAPPDRWLPGALQTSQ